MTYGSICSGIEAATVAWHPLGWKAAWYSEIEPFPCSVLRHHYPDVPNLGDMLAGDFEEKARLAGPIDLLVGGTPCQSFSIAGQRKGLADDRGNLTLRFVEVLHGLAPRWFVWENVPGVLSDQTNAFGCFLAGCAGAAAPLQPPIHEQGWANAGVVSGPRYGLAWRVLDAEYFGVPQRRNRVFVVGHLGDWRRAAQVLFEPGGLSGNTPKGGKAGEEVAGCLGGGSGSRGWCDDTDRAGAFIPEVSETLRANGGQGSRQDKQPMIPVAVAFEARLARNGRGGLSDVVPPLKAQSGESGKGDAAPLIAFDTTQITSKGNYSAPKKPMDPCHPLASGAHPPSIAFHATQDPISGEISPAMGQGSKQGCGSIGVQSGMVVRRLTARECERLQGFPDDYTIVHFRGKPAADGPRYKAIGNSMAVPVMAWIGRRIQMVEDLA